MEEPKIPSEGGPAAAAPAPSKRGKGLWIGVAAIIVVLAVILALFAAGVFNPPATQTPPPPPATPLRIGAVLSLSGGLGSYGPDILEAIQMAISEINAQGGVNGTDVQFSFADDGTQATQGALAATTLIQNNHVDAIIGALGSGVSAAVLNVCIQNRVVEVSPASTSPLFSNASYTGGWFYRTVPSDALQGVVAAHYAYTNRSWRNVSVIGINNPYGNGLATVFANSFTALGGHVRQKVIVLEAQASYTTYLNTVFGSGSVDGVYLVAYPDTGIQLMADWWANHNSWPTQWLFSEGLKTQDFIDNLTARSIAVTGDEGTAPVSPAGALYNTFATKFQRLFGHAPGLFASQGYDAAYMIALAAMKANGVSGAAIKSQMIAISGGSAGTGTKVYPGPGNFTLARNVTGAINYEGASGSLNWNSLGDPTSSYEVWGLDAGSRIIDLHFFPESLVISWTS